METIVFHSDMKSYDENEMWKIMEKEAERLKENLAMGSFIVGEAKPDPKIKISFTAWTQETELQEC